MVVQRELLVDELDNSGFPKFEITIRRLDGETGKGGWLAFFKDLPGYCGSAFTSDGALEALKVDLARTTAICVVKLGRRRERSTILKAWKALQSAVGNGDLETADAGIKEFAAQNHVEPQLVYAARTYFREFIQGRANGKPIKLTEKSIEVLTDEMLGLGSKGERDAFTTFLVARNQIKQYLEKRASKSGLG